LLVSECYRRSFVVGKSRLISRNMALFSNNMTFSSENMAFQGDNIAQQPSILALANDLLALDQVLMLLQTQKLPSLFVFTLGWNNNLKPTKKPARLIGKQALIMVLFEYFNIHSFASPVKCTGLSRDEDVNFVSFDRATSITSDCISVTFNIYF